ncbi:hypothetical protein [Actinomadura macra]|uniref:hypothetical protein n=1 Tax=Actinomadura macra TaxID=46164 RepID=UPI0008347851|nr:hypothetical protein [Actinomadura macra]
MADIPPSTELALLRGELMTALARIEGDVRLVLQEQQQGTRRLDELATDVRRLDERLDAVERTAVTRAEADERETRMRAQLDEQARRRLTVAGLIITAITALLSGGIAVIGIITS